jgi:glycyl-tRNA synthetase
MKSLKDIVALCKRRGFVFPASDIYNGINGFWDYGPLAIELKNNLRDAWWKSMVLCPPLGPNGELLTIVGLDSSIIQNPSVWKASGHVDGFSDPMVDCRETKARYRADHIEVFVPKSRKGVKFAVLENSEADVLEKRIKKFARDTKIEDYEKVSLVDLDLDEYNTIIGPEASAPGTLTEPREFNLMFKTEVGALSGSENIAYLRPETAQGIFLNYKNVLDSSRVKVPFGIAQIGKAFRNEVTPRNFIFRSREFEQMEMEWFCHPSEAALWHSFWKENRLQWWKEMGLSTVNMQLRQHDKDELAHYAKDGVGTIDIEYAFPFSVSGFGELEGIAHRCDFDLRQHQLFSKVNLEYFDVEKNEKYLPHVIEPAAGLSRGVLALLCEAYTLDPNRPSGVYLKFSPKIAPIKAAILPLTAKDGLPEIAQKIYMQLRKNYNVELDIKQNIGKRYARQDEIGTPYCFTVDHDSLTDGAVTVRDRDTMEQQRLKIDDLEAFLESKVKFS